MLQREIVVLAKAEHRHSLDEGEDVRRIPRRNRRHANPQYRRRRFGRNPS
jgi:hypothetical protein